MKKLTLMPLFIALLVAPSNVCSDIVIQGNGVLQVIGGPDSDGLDGTPYTFKYVISDGTTWVPVGGGFGFGAEISSASLVLNGTSVTLNPNESPLFATNQGSGAGAWAGLISNQMTSGYYFTAFGDPDVLIFGGFHTIPATLSSGDPVLLSQLAAVHGGYFSQMQSLNGSTYNPTQSTFSMSGSTVPEPLAGSLMVLPPENSRFRTFVSARLRPLFAAWISFCRL